MPDYRLARERDNRRRELDALSGDAERLYHRLKPVVDDFGRFPADPDLILAGCFPRARSRYSAKRIAVFLTEMVRQHVIHVYRAADGQEYLQIVDWERDQRKRAKHSKYPEPLDLHANASGCEQARAFAVDLRLTTNDLRSTTNEEEASTSPEVVVVGSGVQETAKPLDESPDLWAAKPWGTPYALAALYNDEAHDDLPAVEKLDATRQTTCRKYLNEYPSRDFWMQAFRATHRSLFLRGKAPPEEGRKKPFRADFDWFLQRGKNGVQNVVKAWEGKYD